MKHCQLFFPVLLLFLFTACETPSESFERSNKNDPASPNFAGGTVTGLSAVADSSGSITLRWPSADNSVDKHVIEKSLGDSLSFSPIAELEPTETTFIDESRDIKMNTYYRLSSYMEVEGEGDVLYGRTDTKLEFGSISAVEYEFLEESNQLKLIWSTDVPFFTHFIISSDRVISDQQESTVRISAATNKHAFQDPLLDIDFDSRLYTITGIIEEAGIDNIVIEKEFEFNAASFFKPSNFEINILNEQDWELTWKNNVFFATEVEITRSRYDDDTIFKLPPGSTSFTDTLILDNRGGDVNRFRMYSIRILSESGSSQEVEGSDMVEIEQPIIAISNFPQNDPNSLTIYWSSFGNDKDLIKEYVIEKPHFVIPDRFVEVARVDGNATQYTDLDVSESESPTYRVRTVTSFPSNPVSYTYSHDYERVYWFATGMDYVTSLELSSSKRYLASASFTSGRGNSIFVVDIDSKQLVSKISIPSQQISDIKISADDSSIYFSVPTEGAIYKADFPAGENVEKIIDDARVNTENVFHLDISRDESFLIGTGGRGFVKRWNLDTYEAEFLFSEYKSPTFYLYKNTAISPDGTLIGGNNGSNYILNANDGSVLKNLAWTDENITDVQFSADGNYYAFSEFTRTHVFSTTSWEKTERSIVGRRIDFHPEKPNMVLTGRNSVYTYDVKNKSIMDVISDDNGFQPYPRSQNAIIFIDDDRIGTVDGEETIRIWKKKGPQRRWKYIHY